MSEARIDWAKSTVSIPFSADELRDRVDARLRQRRLELRVVGDVDRCGAVRGRLLGEAVDAGADDHAGDVAAQRGRLREDGERPLLELAAVMLEEDERAHLDQPLLGEERDDLLRAAAVVLDLAGVAARRRIGESEHLGA